MFNEGHELSNPLTAKVTGSGRGRHGEVDDTIHKRSRVISRNANKREESHGIT